MTVLDRINTPLTYNCSKNLTAGAIKVEAKVFPPALWLPGCSAALGAPFKASNFDVRGGGR